MLKNILMRIIDLLVKIVNYIIIFALIPFALICFIGQTFPWLCVIILVSMTIICVLVGR